MIKQKRMLALVGAGALVMGMVFASTASVLADGQVSWTGNGTTDGQLDTEQCDQSNTPYIHWVFTTGGGSVTAASITFGGSGSGTFAMTQNGGGSWSYDSGFFTLATLTASVSYTGTVGNANLVISHGCPGVQVTPPPTEEITAPPTPEVTPTFDLQTAAITDAPSFGASVGDLTDAPSEPSTDSIGTNGTSAPADGAWLLVVALGVLLASIVVLTPARAKSRR